jgi:hypothetical protein
MVQMGRWYLWSSRNTSMHVRTLLMTASLAALAPVISNAGPENAALKTCTAAFASSLSIQGTASPAVKLKYLAGPAASSFAEFYARDYTFTMKANDPKTGLALARATCSATTGGTLLSLSAIPTDTGKVLAAQL